jgi:hypothetical protein
MSTDFAVVEPEPRHAQDPASWGDETKAHEPKHCGCQVCIHGFRHVVAVKAS